MIHTRKQLELLAPAKNADIGIEAINHGADAIYIGGPAFGARANAENTVADIERLARHAHRFGARVFVTCNTILFDEEVAAAERLIRQLHEAGADALIVQDMGILELDLPPIQLHASTQTDIRHPEKARFLQDVGFSQIVLAREMTLAEIRKVAAATDCTLEFFIHGALCVAFSGQCYISHAHTGRSANRGECSQACRLPYDLTDKDGNLVASNQHLLSMKDNNQSANLRALADAGISSFKIEGRYKDMAYVKNITAHYRLLLDEIMADTPEYSRTSAGRSTFLFQPLADKTFNRGATDYFVNGRTADIGAFDSPKFVGEPVGSVIRWMASSAATSTPPAPSSCTTATASASTTARASWSACGSTAPRRSAKISACTPPMPSPPSSSPAAASSATTTTSSSACSKRNPPSAASPWMCCSAKPPAASPSPSPTRPASRPAPSCPTPRSPPRTPRRAPRPAGSRGSCWNRCRSG